MLPKTIDITTNIGQSLQHFLNETTYSQLAILVDENTAAHCLPIVKSFLPENILTIQIQSGEENKHLGTCQQIWQAMTDAAFDRKALLINLGGGVIGDMGGFCAATYKRGIRFLNLPTTLLSQVDASVGGKLGIDFGPYKNHIGIFKEPETVIVYPEFIHSLPQEELRSGYAEIIKHCLIQDADYWKVITQRQLQGQDWPAHIDHSVRVKYKVVTEDPTEKGLRKILNFGHTIGHAVESHFLNHENGRLLHGEAIAIGMIAESWLSITKGEIQESELKEIQDYLLSIYGKVDLSQENLEEIALHCLQDKKNDTGKIKASLLHQVGDCAFDIEITLAEVKAALQYYQSL
ncbi:3-dehydroquinate synthase [Persicobacter diffluens]|uniref:3-dehydroquinate synthase n=1 Tax=Persicobacter diffluens TaxID=981 RepID=A0AAN5AIV6_9BACT|nr:3-dehydroquinate synthase [Persicobacter diffluens]